MSVDVSIIMGIYNCEKTLDEAIESLLNQTYKEWKLIMVDDGSTDDTFLVGKKYADKYDNIYLYKNERNMGLNYTLNRCLEYADTKYIARMDGDDISLPSRLEKEVDFLDKNPRYAFVSCSMVAFDEKDDWGMYINPKKPRPKDFMKKSPFCHAPCMVRYDAYKAVGGYTVEKNLLRVEDLHLWIKLYSKGYIGYNLPDILYKMRDDRNAQERRKYKYRINEARVRWIAIKEFKMPIYNIMYVVRPLIVGLLPRNIYKILHKSSNR